MTGDPRVSDNAELIREASVDSNRLDSFAQGGGEWGRGGMITKLRAARLASRSATSTIIVSGSEERVLNKIGAGENCGTLLYSNQEKLASRKQWLGGILLAKGRITLDSGACVAVRQQGSSLLAVGVKEVVGNFERGDLVALDNQEGEEMGRGIINYSSRNVCSLRGKVSLEIESILGYSRDRGNPSDNLVVGSF